MLTLYKYVTALLAFASTISLLMTGEMNPLFALPGVIMMFPGYFRYITGRPPISRWLVAGLALLEILVLSFDLVFVSSDYLIAIAHMTIVFQALKSFDMREPWDPLQVYFMSLLQMIIVSELSLSILVGVAFGIFIVIFMAAMVLSHFMKEGTLGKMRVSRPVTIVSVTALILTVFFFVSVPRTSGSLWGRQSAVRHKTVGFGGDLDLGSYGEVLENPAIAMRVEVFGQEPPYYWRGSTLDIFDGRSWRSSSEKKRSVIRSGSSYYLDRRWLRKSENNIKQDIIVEPMDTNIIFTLGIPVIVKARGWMLDIDDSGTLSLRGKSGRRVSYTVISQSDNVASRRPVKDLQSSLQLPAGMGAVASLAARVSEGKDGDMQIAMAIETHLLNNYQYTLSPAPAPSGVSPVDWFLGEGREGYCEHYSTAMALMLRTLGIPARIVTGFYGGESNEFGDYVIVRQSNAHSWVEADIDGAWVRFDPTPARAGSGKGGLALMLDNLRMQWYRYIIGFGRSDQVAMLSTLTMPVFKTPDIKGLSIDVSPLYFLVIVASGILAAVLLIGRQNVGIRHSYSSRVYLKFRARVKKKGGLVLSSSSAEEVAIEALRLGGRPESVNILTTTYLRCRFGSHPLSAQDKAHLRQHLDYIFK